MSVLSSYLSSWDCGSLLEVIIALINLERAPNPSFVYKIAIENDCLLLVDSGVIEPSRRLGKEIRYITTLLSNVVYTNLEITWNCKSALPLPLGWFRLSGALLNKFQERCLRYRAGRSLMLGMKLRVTHMKPNDAKLHSASISGAWFNTTMPEVPGVLDCYLGTIPRI